MNLPNAYTWEAEWGNGAILTQGEDLAGCVRFSLIPTVPGLPQHDIMGVPMIRRFNRAFVRALGGGMKEYLYCVVCKGFRIWVSASKGSLLITPEGYEVYL